MSATSSLAMLERRRRAVDAMGLGPLWLLKTPVRDDGPAETGSASIASMDFDALVEAVTTCRACALCETRTQAVFGDGVRRPESLVVGSAPTRDDEIAGSPLTGQPGRLLDAMLASIELSRQRNVFVTTAVKCRPPEDRAPLPIEIATCRPYLERQIALLAPRRALAIGDSGARALSEVLGGTRGVVHVVVADGHSMPAVATHHPARLLAEPGLKAEAWSDLCAARTS